MKTQFDETTNRLSDNNTNVEFADGRNSTRESMIAMADALVNIGEYWNLSSESAVDAAEHARFKAFETVEKIKQQGNWPLLEE